MGGTGEKHEGGGRYRAKIEVMLTHRHRPGKHREGLTRSNTDLGKLVKKLDRWAQGSQSA